MDVRMQTVVGFTVLSSAGRMDGHGSKKLRQATAAFSASTPTPLIVDLSETTALLASGAEAILHLAQRWREAGVALAVVGANSSAQRLMDASGMTAFIPVFSTIAEARRMLSPSTSNGER